MTADEGSDPTDRDPPDTYDVTSWEPRSLLDKLSVGAWEGVVLLTNVVLLLVAVLILGSQAAIVGFGFVVDPLVAAFTAVSLVPALLIAVDLRRLGLRGWPATSLIGGTFVLAMAFAAFALIPNTVLRARVTAFSTVPLVGTAAFFFLVVAPVEETTKLLAVRLYGYRSRAMATASHGAVLGAFAGLGFATTENAFYIATQQLGGVGGLAQISVTRAVAGPGHVLFSTVAGYYLGLAKDVGRYRGAIAMKGLLIAAFLHGSYNTLVSFLVDLPAWMPTLEAPIALGGRGWFVIGLSAFYLVVGTYVFRKLNRFRAVVSATSGGVEAE